MDITKLITEFWEKDEKEKARAYIGASSVGHDCTAMLSFSHRGYPNNPPDQRLKRIFRDGHRIEYVVVSDLTKAGIHVMEKDPMTGKQWRGILTELLISICNMTRGGPWLLNAN